MTTSHTRSLKSLIPGETKQYWREGHPNFKPFSVGDRVLRKRILQGNSVNLKFQPRYSGPYTVNKVRENGLTYEISDGLSNLRTHHKQLHRWVELPHYVSSDPILMDLMNSFTGNYLDSIAVADSDGSAEVKIDSDFDSEFLGFPLAVPVPGYDRTVVSFSDFDDSSGDEELNAGSYCEAPPNSVPVQTLWTGSCLLYTSPSPRDKRQSRMPSSA